MRVLQMIPDIGVSNGVVSTILNYAKALSNDVVFDFLYFHETENDRRQDIEALGGNVFKINQPSPKSVVSNPEIDKLFSDNANVWDVVHINAPHFAVFLAPIARKYGIKKVCVHCHTSVFSLNPKNEKRNKMLAMMGSQYPDRRFACSKDAGQLWYGRKNFSILNNAIDCIKYDYDESVRNKIRTNLGLTNDTVYCHIGMTSVAQKNHSFLINVFKDISNVDDNCKLLLIGAEKTDELVALCEENNILDKVLFLGIRNDVNELLQASDVFIFPSISEGLPVSVIEAQASGLPVLKSDNVTDEVCLCQHVYSMSLEQNSKEWANKAIALSLYKRDINANLKVRESGWDIYSCSQILLDYYKG